MTHKVSKTTKLLLAIVIVGVVYYFVTCSSKPIHNVGSLEYPQDQEYEDVSDLSSDPNVSKLERKMLSRDSAVGSGRYKNSSYDKGIRGNGSDIDAQFEPNTPFGNANEYQGIDSGDKYAYYKSTSEGQLSEEDKFDADKLLPQERVAGWFEDPTEPTNIRSTHLININRPMAVNTIQTSRRNASHDIRGEPANPKQVVSPWGNSSYEPDTSIRSGGLC